MPFMATLPKQQEKVKSKEIEELNDKIEDLE
jgi:hypothetical protein